MAPEQSITTIIRRRVGEIAHHLRIAPADVCQRYRLLLTRDDLDALEAACQPPLDGSTLRRDEAGRPTHYLDMPIVVADNLAGLALAYAPRADA